MKIHWLFLGQKARGEKLLHSALWGTYEDAKWLLKINTNIDFIDEEERSALTIAAGRGHTNFVKLLLEKGASVNHKNKEKKTALMISAEKGYADIVKLLLEYGAETKLSDLKGNIANDYARNDAVSNLLMNEKMVKSVNSKSSQHPISLEEILSLKYTNKNEDRDWEEINDFKSINDLLIEAQMSYYDYQNNKKYKTLLKKLPPISKFHDFDVVYIWTAKTYVALENTKKAKEILYSGLEHSKRLFFIMEELGEIYFKEGNFLSIGWWMKSCIIGTESYMPYLYLSYAAKFHDKDELSKRLLAAADVISWRTKHRFKTNDIISRIYEVLRKNDNETKAAFETFENKIKNYLPPTDLLPDDDSFFAPLSLNSDDLSSKIFKARKKLIERFAN